METNRYRIDAVYNAGKIIEIISNSREPVAASELAAQINVSDNTAYRMCQTLEELRILESIGKKFILGMALAHCWARYKSRREAECVKMQTELKNLEIREGAHEDAKGI